MIPLPKKLIESVVPTPRTYRPGPLQAQLGRDPWKVMIASMLLHRTPRAIAQPQFDELLRRWSGPAELARANHIDGLERRFARRLIRASTLWFSEYNDLRDFPGVGLYVADAVGLFCFNCTELESNDQSLREYADLLEAMPEICGA